MVHVRTTPASNGVTDRGTYRIDGNQVHLTFGDGSTGTATIKVRQNDGRITELMGRWDYSSPGVLELRYEDVLGNEAFWFKRIFKWYGFSGDMVSKGVEIALRYSQEKLRPGDPGNGHGNRKSRPGYWREHFTDPIRKAFRKSYGDVLVKLGYESGPDW